MVQKGVGRPYQLLDGIYKHSKIPTARLAGAFFAFRARPQHHGEDRGNVGFVGIRELLEKLLEIGRSLAALVANVLHQFAGVNGSRDLCNQRLFTVRILIGALLEPSVAD